MSIKTKIDKAMSDFALNIVDEAKKNDTKLSDKTEAFKALTAYYGHLTRSKSKKDEDEGDIPTFEGYRRRVANLEDETNGRTVPKTPRLPTDN